MAAWWWLLLFVNIDIALREARFCVACLVLTMFTFLLSRFRVVAIPCLIYSIIHHLAQFLFNKFSREIIEHSPERKRHLKTLNITNILFAVSRLEYISISAPFSFTPKIVAIRSIYSRFGITAYRKFRPVGSLSFPLVVTSISRDFMRAYSNPRIGRAR